MISFYGVPSRHLRKSYLFCTPFVEPAPYLWGPDASRESQVKCVTRQRLRTKPVILADCAAFPDNYYAQGDVGRFHQQN